MKKFQSDGTRISFAHCNSTVLSVRGRNQVGKLTSRQRNCNATSMFTMKASRKFVSTFFDFLQHKSNPRLKLTLLVCCYFSTTFLKECNFKIKI
jgi:hypothetical protein